MAGAASHLLSQPLTAVLGNLELIVDRLGELPADVGEQFRRAYQAATEAAEDIKRIQKVKEHYTVRYVGDDEIVDLEAADRDPEGTATSLADEVKRSRRSRRARSRSSEPPAPARRASRQTGLSLP